MWPSLLVNQVIRVVLHHRLYLKMVEFPADETLDIEDAIRAFSITGRKLEEATHIDYVFWG